ncbi:nucleoside phosphatase GDA1/CD39 [Sporodiniella umbellata]|nr:nucleoside phosphatase GDA1/CD39 [Sporodiniella umbellata]
MIDAGSSGSRVHVYKFNHCKQMPELENEVFQAIEPGLSHYKDDPQAAANSLDALLETALKEVPGALQKCTPIAIKATAGLRLLGNDQSEKILSVISNKLKGFPFLVDSIGIMDAKEEGVFAWLTVNFLSGHLDPTVKNTVGVFDLGGASTQIVFEPSAKMPPGDHVYRLEMENTRYDLYQHSYLGYGLNEARKKIKLHIKSIWKKQHVIYNHPCLPENHTEVLQNFKLTGTGAGHVTCRGLIEGIFKKEKSCQQKPCSFGGIYQPSFADTFMNRDLYIFSYFYDLTKPLGMPSEFTVQEFGELASHVCEQNFEVFKKVPNAVQLLKNNPDYCLDLTYMYTLLRFGYEIPSHWQLKTAKKIKGAETGWSLGASIAMIKHNSGKCKR